MKKHVGESTGVSQAESWSCCQAIWLGRSVLALAFAIMLSGCTSRVDLNQMMSAYHSEAIKAGVSRARIDPDDPFLRERKIILASTINALSSVEVIQDLLYLDSQSDEPINLFIDTSGGHLDQAMAILDLIPTLRSPVNTWAIGKCNSGGAMLLMAGTGTRYIYPSTILVIHGPQVTSGDPPREMTRFLLERVNILYREHARFPNDWLPIGMNDLHYLTPTQAVGYGVADEIVAARE